MKHALYILIFMVGISYSGFSQNKLISGNTPVSTPKFIKFYPNPASSYIYFDFQNGYNQDFSLLVFNFSGKKVYEMKNMPSKVTIDLNDFYRGLYIYQLRDKSGIVIESGKFQVIK